MQRKGGASRVAVRRRARSGVGRTPAGPRRSLTAAEEAAAKEEAAKDNNKVVKVINDEVEEVEEVEEDLRDLLVLKYTSIFKVFLRKDKKGVVVRYFNSTALTFIDARLFAI